MEKKESMEKLAHAAYERAGFNGVWLYAEKGEIVSKGAVGFRDPENTQPMREDSIFDIASISKQFTAAGIMLLRRRGLLSLDDEITKYFPKIPYQGITIRHLLTHTSGFSDYDDEIERIFEEEGVIPDNGVILRIRRVKGNAGDPTAPETAGGDPSPAAQDDSQVADANASQEVGE